VLTQAEPTATQFDVGITVAHGVTPHDVMAPTYRSTDGWQLTPLAAPQVHVEQVTAPALRVTPPATVKLVPEGQVGGAALPE
jgi:hypothetical protein